jgi:hypothetical protein
MAYDFLEVGELSCAEVARQIRGDLLGRLAVCTSFDSGKLIQPARTRVNG